MLAIQYKMEEYIQDQHIKAEDIFTVRDFVQQFLKILHLKKGEFAGYIEINDSNLNKVYNNQRPLNADLAMKLGHFFHIPADLWMKVQLKNEFLLFQTEMQSQDKYQKYDYEKVLQIA